MARVVVTSVDALPRINAEPGLDWRPLQHFAGLTAFGCNVFRAEHPGVTLVAEHDEAASGHEEVYVVLEGVIGFELDGERHTCTAGGIVAVLDPSVQRSATGDAAGATLLAISNAQQDRYESTWDASHFAGLPTADD